MTGQEFLDVLQKQIQFQGQLNREYNAADLTRDAAASGLWFRRPNPSEYEAEREAAIESARKVVTEGL